MPNRLMDDYEKQLVEIRSAFLNLFNASSRTEEKFEMFVKKTEGALNQFDKRLSKIEKLLKNRNGNSEE